MHVSQGNYTCTHNSYMYSTCMLHQSRKDTSVRITGIDTPQNQR